MQSQRAAALPPLKLAWKMAKPVAHSQRVQELGGTLSSMRRCLSCVNHGDYDVLDRGKIRKQVIALKDEPEVPAPDPGQLLIRQPGHFHSLK